MSAAEDLESGLVVFSQAFEPKMVAIALQKTAIWVSPDTFRLLPVWYPHTARKEPLYKANWEDPLTNRGKPKFQGNTDANSALTRALGLTKKLRPKWTCCHIWGSDNDRDQGGCPEVQDRRYFSCLANMVLFPEPLKSFTDSVPEIKAALRFASYRLYGFVPEGRSVPDPAIAEDWLPESWHDGVIPDVQPLTPKIRRSAQTRARSIGDLLRRSPGQYPADEVRCVLKYWNEKIPDSLLSDPTLNPIQ